jgi:hypothetical protein
MSASGVQLASLVPDDCDSPVMLSSHSERFVS